MSKAPDRLRSIVTIQRDPTGLHTIVAPQTPTVTPPELTVRSPTRTTASSSETAGAHPPRDASNRRSRIHRDLRCRSHHRSYYGTSLSSHLPRIRDKPK